MLQTTKLSLLVVTLATSLEITTGNFSTFNPTKIKTEKINRYPSLYLSLAGTGGCEWPKPNIYSHLWSGLHGFKPVKQQTFGK
jgi:hypothetical protein